ncbi:hypothetical protein MRX96_036845 [Rhipicephalus microplus]
MPLSSKDMWGVLRGSCNETSCGTEQGSGVVEVSTQSAQPEHSKDETMFSEYHPLSSKHELDLEEQPGVACHEGVSQEIPFTSAPRESVDEAPRSSKAGKKFHDWLFHNMPEFSDSFQPVLQEKAVSERLQKKKLSRQLHAELTWFLNENNLITIGNKGERRSMFKVLGKALAAKYPMMLWDEPEEHLLATRTHVYSLFIKRLTVARKVRNHRKSKRGHVTVLSPTTEITKENAVAELQALKATHLSAVTLDTEIDLRFKSSIGDLERKLRAVSEAFACKEQRECTFTDIVKHLQGHSRHTLINEMALPDDVQITAPHV